MTFLSEPTLLDRIADAHLEHARTTAWWKAEDEQLKAYRAELRRDLEERNGTSLGPIGFVGFSHVEMGAISTLDLFGLDELIIFAFYWRNRDRYSNVVDLGANIGLHSVVLASMGMTVTAYEPDPNHVAQLHAHLRANEIESLVSVRQAAVSRETGRLEFVRVLGNTTGSHLAGAKKDPYGELEIFEVDAVGVNDAVGASVDLVKMDVEGLESELLAALPIERLKSLDLICEVGTAANAEMLYNRFAPTDVNLFAQKRGWARVEGLDDMPVSYKEGSLFISIRDAMPWEYS